MTEPRGERFSRVYLRNPELLKDSDRMRRRLAALFVKYEGLGRLGETLNEELGIRVDSNARYASFWGPFLETMALRDVLDAVTLRYREIVDHRGNPDYDLRKTYLQEVARVFSEEDVQYRVDNAGGVHFALDPEFERMRVSTIRALGGGRYKAVLSAFDDAFAALDRSPPDGKAAVRSAFFAAEALFRLMFPSAHQLSGGELQKHLKPLLDQRYAEKPAVYAAQKMLASLSDWIDGAHFYRHEPGTEEPAQPPLDLAVYIVSQAGGHIRWLAALDPKS